ncbi:Dop1p [Saccharomyces eubayanus]|uniref:Dop1p n=1 Tax=Saccharomyces eubayanus TaxID=1080349 RepID=UPI0006C1A4BC|nr:DOP1-like protein [Saccharomyces eubayanus]KOH00987.1 DOP1-like protein [Saccharomyces eubayanus]
MSLPLKPLTIDSNNKQIDSKQKKFRANVERALERFDSVTEWADYIASLGTLLKALQSWSPKFQNVKYYVPSPYQVSRRLTSSLSPALPAGVHQKTLEVYTYIFEHIGLETLAAECNIWIPGILPLMTYASMSVRSHLIELYDSYILQLPQTTLRLLIRPLISSLLPGIDDESSDFLPLTLKLIETLQENLADDSLFWQTLFLVMTANKGRRLGGLTWLTRKFPSLNAVPHLVNQTKNETEEDTSETGTIDSHLDRKKKKEGAFKILLPAARDLVTPEPGLLVRCLVGCLEDENDILIKRSVLDLLLQRLRLDSPVLNVLITPEDKKLLIMSCCRTTLSKDMSLNRRIWNWLLGPTSGGLLNNNGGTSIPDAASANSAIEESNVYFRRYGLGTLLEGLNDLLSEEESILIAFRISMAVMDRWEIGSLVIPELFIPLLSSSEKFKQNEQIMKTARTFFDNVETNVIWGKLFQKIEDYKNLKILDFVLTNFNIGSDEEIIVRHLPLILLALLALPSSDNDLLDICKLQKFSLYNKLLSYIPERALLPLSHSKLKYNDALSSEELLNKIHGFYTSVSNPSTSEKENTNECLPPFTTEDLTFLIVKLIHEKLLSSLSDMESINESSKLFISIFEKIPESNVSKGLSHPSWSDEELIQRTFKAIPKLCESNNDAKSKEIVGIVEIFGNYLYSRMQFIESMKLLKVIMTAVWKSLKDPHHQILGVKNLKTLNRFIPPKFIESALVYTFVEESDISERLGVLDLLWTQLDSNTDLIRHPLELILGELFDDQNPYYLTVSKWILSIINSGSATRLFYILTDNILKVSHLEKEILDDRDDLEMLTYEFQMLAYVLKTNNGRVRKLFSTELTSIKSLDIWKNEDVSTYKSLLLVMLMRFLNIKNNTHAKSIRSALILLDILLDGTEDNFKDIVIFLLQMSSKYIAEEGIEPELIAVSLLDIVSKVLRLSHDNGIKLDIFDDNAAHLKYIDYLVTSVSNMKSPLIVTAYVKLLSESIIYFEHSIFRMILPLSASLVQCVQRLFLLEKKEGGYYQPVGLLLGGLEELLEISHGYLVTDQREGYFSGSNLKGDFIQSVVSNVFSSDSSNEESRIQGERDVILQSFRQVISCCLDIWYWAHSISGISNNESSLDMTNHNSYKFKFRSKKLLETLFLLEPLELLENLINIRPDDVTVTLVHVLDGNKPAMTIPHLLYGVIIRYNRTASVKFSNRDGSVRASTTKLTKGEPSMLKKLSGESIIAFLFKYVDYVENSAIEEFYGDFLLFFREVATNYNLYSDVSLPVLKLVALISEKVSKTQFGEQKRVRREISDVFFKYLPNAFINFPNQNRGQSASFKDLEFVVWRVQYIVNDQVGGDKFNTTLSTIVNQCLTPYIKPKSEKAIPNYALELAVVIANLSSKVKSWRLLIAELFQNDKKLSVIGSNRVWEKIIYEWSVYPENKSKILNDLLLEIGSKRSGVAPTLITFNLSNESEVEYKCQNLSKISYLLMISPNDAYLLQFSSLISCVCQYLVSKDIKLKGSCWILLRVLLLRFSESHFNDYWSMISYCLQTNLQEFYESLQIQSEVDSQTILQICKTLDLLLLLNMEGFTSTNEWIFVIDTINCVYKTNSFVALVDEIAEFKDYEISKIDDLELPTTLKDGLPLLRGIHKIERHSQLRKFFQNLSYVHYEKVYGLGTVDLHGCSEDLKKDILS